MSATLAHTAFRAMGTDIEVIGGPELTGEDRERVQFWFQRVESLLSRFLPESELSRLNRSAGRPFSASALLYRVLADALDAAAASGGLFDPALLNNVRAAGYDRSFEKFGVGPIPASRPPRVHHAPVRLLPSRRILLPIGAGIDLGGFAKGWAVDRCATILSHHAAWLVNAGGDLLARGEGPDGSGWLVGVEDPLIPGKDVAVLRLFDRAVATSSVMRRRWHTQDGRVAHHVIDPRTGRPSETDIASVTVISDSVAAAEVEAKVLLLLGRREAMRRAEFTGIPAVLVSGAGEMSLVGGAGAYLAL